MIDLDGWTVVCDRLDGITLNALPQSRWARVFAVGDPTNPGTRLFDAVPSCRQFGQSPGFCESLLRGILCILAHGAIFHQKYNDTVILLAYEVQEGRARSLRRDLIR